MVMITIGYSYKGYGYKQVFSIMYYVTGRIKFIKIRVTSFMYNPSFKKV